jgi:hypothetical protein
LSQGAKNAIEIVKVASQDNIEDDLTGIESLFFCFYQRRWHAMPRGSSFCFVVLILGGETLKAYNCAGFDDASLNGSS